MKSLADLSVTDVSPLVVEGADGKMLGASDMAEARRLAKRAANQSNFRPAGIYDRNMQLLALVTADSVGHRRH
jgi:hypothetical protein